jgi:hypothetical protein
LSSMALPKQSLQHPKQLTRILKVRVLAYIIDGQTMILGEGGLPITASGTVLSLEQGEESVFVVRSQKMDINELLRDSGSVERSREEVMLQ